MEVKLIEIQCIFEAFKKIPELVPNRWKLVSELVQDCQHLIGSQECPKIYVGGGEKEKSVGIFSGTPKECEDVYHILHKVGLHRNDILKCMETVIAHTSNNALKPIILVPPVEKCYGNRLRMDSRPCFPLVYTLKGTYIAALFHGVCKICKMRFYYRYREKDEGNEVIRVYYSPYDTQKYFQLSSCSLYEKQLLQDVTHNIVFSACTFESRVDTYRANNKIIDQR